MAKKKGSKRARYLSKTTGRSGWRAKDSKRGSSPQRRRVKYYLPIILALVLILGGVSLIFWATWRHGWQYQTTQTSQSQQEQARVEHVSKPTKIYIPKLERTLDISDGFVENNRWKIADTGVSYLVTSGQVGKLGNAVIYGHNTAGILGGLWKVQNGDFVEVTASDGKVYKYEIFERKEVKPNAIEILTQSDDARLTIYTCSGFLDSARFVVVGKLVS